MEVWFNPSCSKCRIATLQHGRALQAAGLLNGKDGCEVFLTINKVFLLEVLEATTCHAEEAI